MPISDWLVVYVKFLPCAAQAPLQKLAEGSVRRRQGREASFRRIFFEEILYLGRYLFDFRFWHLRIERKRQDLSRDTLRSREGLLSRILHFL